jgi:antitoxin FitA
MVAFWNLMATLTIKNIPAGLYERLKKSAVINRRSINSEVIVCIEQSLLAPKSDPAATLSRIRALRTKSVPHQLTDAELHRIKG